MEEAAQKAYLNCAACIQTGLSPTDLLGACREIESSHGRSLSRLKGEPRTLDIDILFYGDQLIRTPLLVIPHERYADRRFVLEPVAEIAPDFICPDTGMTVAESLEACGDRSHVLTLSPEGM